MKRMVKQEFCVSKVSQEIYCPSICTDTSTSPALSTDTCTKLLMQYVAETSAEHKSKKSRQLYESTLENVMIAAFFMQFALRVAIRLSLKRKAIGMSIVTVVNIAHSGHLPIISRPAGLNLTKVLAY